MEIEMDLYNKLLKVGILRANPRTKQIFDKKKTILDSDTAQLFENGVSLGKYLAIIKELLVSKNSTSFSDFRKKIIKI